MSDHDWKPFDIAHGYYVRRIDGQYQLRIDGSAAVINLTDAEFEQLRDTGENPKGLK